ncbi:MAG: hypothetical protein ABL999_06220 [Pyrinomonadaceae bacterium]
MLNITDCGYESVPPAVAARAFGATVKAPPDHSHARRCASFSKGRTGRRPLSDSIRWTNRPAKENGSETSANTARGS